METLTTVNIPKRKEETHKGDYGKILLIGGSANLGGAIMLAARACVYSGSGLITVATSYKSCCTSFSLPRSNGYRY